VVTYITYDTESAATIPTICRLTLSLIFMSGKGAVHAGVEPKDKKTGK
jgi:hypothetical protein